MPPELFEIRSARLRRAWEYMAEYAKYPMKQRLHYLVQGLVAETLKNIGLEEQYGNKLGWLGWKVASPC